MVFRVDLLETYFVHAILLVQSISDVKGFGDYKIHVGDSAEDKNQNALCADGPYLNPSDPESYENNDSTNPFRYGKEIWCNREGRYIFFQADMGYMMYEQQSEMSLCSLGIMGTKYDYINGASPEDTVYVDVGKSTVYKLPFIVPTIAIGNELSLDVKTEWKDQPVP